MAGLAEAGNGLVFASMNVHYGEFATQTGQGDRRDLPDGIIVGPVLGYDYGLRGIREMARQHVTNDTLVVIEHQIDGQRSEVGAEKLCLTATRAGVHGVLFRPETELASKAHVLSMRAIDPGIAAIVGPPRGNYLSQRHRLGVDPVEEAWKRIFQGPLENGARNFYFPGGPNDTVRDEDIARIEKWTARFDDLSGILGRYTIWLDGVHGTNGGMAKVLQAAGQNVNVIITQFGNEPLTEYAANVRRDLAAARQE